MKNSWHIFANDLHNIRSNWLTLVIISGLIFLPSLYAWLNISASWDPYGQTDQLPVGIVNEDEGTTVRDKDIHVGDELIETLTNNDSMDWHFLDRTSAMAELEKGDLFAVIIIPDNFSKRLGSVIDKEPEKAVVDYYVNEKINAIAPKITEKGASVIVDDISMQFTETVNGIIFSLFNEIGLELEAELPDIERFEQYIFDLEERLPDIHDALDDSLADATRAIEIVNSAQKEVPTAQTVVNDGLESIDQVYSFLNDAESHLADIQLAIEQGVSEAEEGLTELNKFIEDLDSDDLKLTESIASFESLEEDVATSLESIENVISIIDLMLEDVEDGEFTDEQRESLEDTLALLQDIEDVLTTGQKQTEQLLSYIEESEQKVSKLFSTVDDVSVKTTDQLNQLIDTFEETIEPTLSKEISSAKDTLSEARTVLETVETGLPEIEELLERTEAHLQDGEELLTEALDEYPFVFEKTTELADNIRSIQEEADIHEIIDLLQNDPETEKGFLSEPVLLNENKLFPIENYGSGMTPFYTILSLWVGGLLLISLLATDVLQPNNYAPHEVYFGKLFIFLLIGCLQTTIVTLGDIFLLKVQMANPAWFIIFGIFCSMIFMTMIYTFVALFGNVGKALAIIMLVLQIAGSGGTYPVALLPKFFQTISPFLPFTYAVGLMREAVGGIVWGNVLVNVIVLAVIGIITITLGAVLKRVINKLTEKFMGETDNSGLFQ